MMHVPQIIIYVVKKAMGHKGELIEGFGRTMMQTLELMQLAKRHILGRSGIEQ